LELLQSGSEIQILGFLGCSRHDDEGSKDTSDVHRLHSYAPCGSQQMREPVKGLAHSCRLGHSQLSTLTAADDATHGDLHKNHYPSREFRHHRFALRDVEAAVNK